MSVVICRFVAPSFIRRYRMASLSSMLMMRRTSSLLVTGTMPRTFATLSSGIMKTRSCIGIWSRMGMPQTSRSAFCGSVSSSRALSTLPRDCFARRALTRAPPPPLASTACRQQLSPSSLSGSVLISDPRMPGVLSHRGDATMATLGAALALVSVGGVAKESASFSRLW